MIHALRFGGFAPTMSGGGIRHLLFLHDWHATTRAARQT